MAERIVAVGSATTVTVVLEDLELSSAEVAVMVTDPVAGGAVQTPPLVMLPALADQLMPLPLPPLALALKVVTELTSLVGAAGETAVTATVCGVIVRVVIEVAPAALVTVRVKVLEAVMAALLKAVPLITVPMPWSTLAVPLLKEGVIRVLPP